MTDKKYYVTERQLRDLKAILEGYEAAPKEINEAGKEEYEAEGGDRWGDITDTIDGYMCAFNRDLKYTIEDIESQEVTFRPVIEKLAQELAHKVRAEMLAFDEETFSLPQSILRHHAYMQSIAVASMFLPCLTELYWGNLWNEALEAEKEKAGGAYDVFMKALEDKDA